MYKLLYEVTYKPLIYKISVNAALWSILLHVTLNISFYLER